MTEAPKNACVWVAGGRDYRNNQRIYYVLDCYRDLHGIRRIVTGAAEGADRLAEDWARSREVPYVGIPARWRAAGEGAGPQRNEQIAAEEKPDVLLAFPGGRGTQSAVEAAERHGIPVYRIKDIYNGKLS